MKRITLAAFAIATAAAPMTASAAPASLVHVNPLRSAVETPAVQTNSVKKNGSLKDERAAVEETYNEWADRVQKKSEEVGDGVSDATSDAWTNVKSAWGEVENASEETWNDAKETFDDAIDRLEKTVEE